MKNLTYILFVLHVLSSCSHWGERRELKQFYSQDFTKFQERDELVVVDLDSMANFSELRESMGQMTCAGKVAGLRFESNDTLYHVTGFADCPTSSETGCYFRRNLLFVRNDSLIIEFGKNKVKKPIGYLKTELENITRKTYNFQYRENNVKPALIHFYADDKYPIATTKKVLREIAYQFSLLNIKDSPDYFKYNILFEGFDITSIPPPPPELSAFED
ncbi:hypothetical protein [Snuella lapsa]|uniref:Lipoprotein n=1 Tax=Snuella lapsa TaxID=870481 RepID=A0ABP6Y6U5_9FLAO